MAMYLEMLGKIVPYRYSRGHLNYGEFSIFHRELKKLVYEMGKLNQRIKKDRRKEKKLKKRK